jgi:membrane-associated phospholipid phosphatase
MSQPERRRLPRRLHGYRDALFRFLRFLAEHVRGFHPPVIAFLLIGLLGALSVAAFAVWARAVVEGGTTWFDESILRWFADRRSPKMDGFMLELTSLGNSVTIIVLLTIASLFLWLTKHHYSVYLLAVGVFGGVLINNVLKLAFHRERPSVVEWVTNVHTQSFPSGHAMTAMIAYGSVAFLVGRLEPTPALRRATWTIATIVILAIGISRVYLGVHYPSDVIAGFIAGLAWLAFVTSGITAIEFFASRKPEVRAEEKDLDAERERAAGVRE